MSDHISNESSVSSPTLSSNELPVLVTITEWLPTFAEATAEHLPWVTIVTHEEDPPSFRLSTALAEHDQEFLPVSPQTAEVILHTHPNINDAVQAITYGLIATIHHRTLHASQELDASCTREQQLRQQITTRSLEIMHLQGRLGTIDIPAGFEPNLGNVVDTVPLSTGEHIIPQFVRRMGSGEVEMLAS